MNLGRPHRPAYGHKNRVRDEQPSKKRISFVRITSASSKCGSGSYKA
jgi:hypothetical protein